MSFGQNVRAIRLHRNMTQSALAKAVSRHSKREITQSVISTIEVTDARTSEHAYAIAKCLQVSTDALFDSELTDEILRNKDTRNVSLIDRSAVYMPVYSLPLKKQWKDLTMEDAVDKSLATHDIDVKNTAWVEINDTSCLPVFHPRTRFLICPKEPTPGDLVLAILPDDTTAIRVYRRPTPATYFLEPLNLNDFASYQLDDPNREKIIGVVDLFIGKVCKY